MSSQLLKECITQFEQHGFGPKFQAYFLHRKSGLLGDAEFARGLLALVMQDDDPSDIASLLLSSLLDQARMGQENGDAYGAGFLETIETAVQTGLADGTLKQEHLMVLAGCYKQVGLPVPRSLMLNVENMAPSPNMENFDLSESLEGVARDVLADGGSAYDLFNTIDAMLAAVPEEIQATLANHFATMNTPVFERCALFMLLSGSDLVQEAIITGLHVRFSQSAMTPETIKLLPMIRGWFAEGKTKAGLDELIKKARRKAVPMQSNTESLCLREIVASITDGVGAQSIIIVLEQDADIFVAMILIKTGHGIKDAFIMPPEHSADAEELIEHLCAETGADNISTDTLCLLLEGALADGVDNRCPPAPGFLDIVEACGQYNLHPQELNLERLLDFSDPERKILDASPQALGRWINDDVALTRLRFMTDSWFEDTEETRKIVMSRGAVETKETKIWNYLENRRDLWARRFLQTAVMLRDAEQLRDWTTLTASAHGLMNGRPLKRIPLMDDIVYMTIKAADMRDW